MYSPHCAPTVAVALDIPAHLDVLWSDGARWIGRLSAKAGNLRNKQRVDCLYLAVDHVLYEGSHEGASNTCRPRSLLRVVLFTKFDNHLARNQSPNMQIASPKALPTFPYSGI